MNLELASLNIINTPRIDAYIETLLKDREFHDPKVQKWIKSNLRNWILREENQERIHLTDRSQFSLLGIHIEPAWLQGKPLPDNLYYVPLNPKLKQQVSAALHHVVYVVQTGQVVDLTRLQVPQAIKDGENTEAIQRQLLIDQHFESEGVKRICNAPNGNYWVSILTPHSLARESKFMGHCVGRPTSNYSGELKAGLIEIWSLRDRNNHPHVTISYTLQGHIIDQIRTKGLGDHGGAAPAEELMAQTQGMVERYWTSTWALFASDYCKQRVKAISKYELNLNFKNEMVWRPHVHGYQIV